MANKAASRQEGADKKKPSLVDFVYGVDEEHRLLVQVAVKEDGRCAVFYNRPFKEDPAWLEFNLGTQQLDFVLDNGDSRDAGLPLGNDITKNMQNTHQVLMVLMDDETGQAKEGKYVPLILHKEEQ
ncbi:MAG: hypothetical protein OEY94_03225 [Alphaproteobacteria bacterium]|nr:hypothetical protein [Alphaproteobacteria bacterium]